MKRRSFKNRPLRRKTLKKRKTLKRRRRRRTKLNRKRGGAATIDTISGISTGTIDVNKLSDKDLDAASSSLSTMKDEDNRRYSDIIMDAITSDKVPDDNLRFLLKTVGNTKINAFGRQKPPTKGRKAAGFADVFTEEQPLMKILDTDECCRGSLKNERHKEKVKGLLLEFIPRGHQPILWAAHEAASARLRDETSEVSTETEPGDSPETESGESLETGGYCIIS